MTVTEIGWVVLAYFLGCFTTGYYWYRWRTGKDLRRIGSGNVGARNVGRHLGRYAFVLTLVADGMKGLLAVVTARALGLGPELVSASLIAVLLGHNFPCQLRFRGGKGVAVSLGAFLAYDGFLLVIFITLLAPLWLVIRRFVLSGMLAYSLAPLIVFLSGLGALATFTVSVTAMLVVFAHRKNIRDDLARLFADQQAKTATNRPPEGGRS